MSLEQYRQKITEQDELLQASKSKQVEEVTVTLETQLTNERMAIERDRAKVKKLAILLGQERAEFAKAKEAFEQKRELFESQKALDVPVTPQWLGGMDRLSLDSSDGDESDTLARLLQKGEAMFYSPTPEPVQSSKEDQLNLISDSGAKLSADTRIKSTQKPPQKQSTRQTSSFARPTAAALLKAQVTKSRLVNRREGKQRQPTNPLTEAHTPRSFKKA